MIWRAPLLYFGLLVFLSGCPEQAELYDFDGDGSLDSLDCAPFDPDVFPGAPDSVGNDIDDNCDGVDGIDADGDGFASVASGGDDCRDDSSDSHPGATEVCDGFDNDCDGALGSDEVDADADEVLSCDGDCDDDQPDVFPGNPELCDGLDNDCLNGPDYNDASGDELDSDGDGVSACAGDCLDTNGAVFPGNEELCDGMDNDCDESLMVGEESDADSDGFLTCKDCNDGDPGIHPQQWDDPADDIDTDCSGSTGTGLGTSSDLKFLGDGVGDQFGSVVEPVGDINNGGSPDFVVTAPRAEGDEGPNAGRTYLFLGETISSLLASGQRTWNVSIADAVFVGEAEHDQSGIDAAGAGDVDDDGYTDLLIGAWQHRAQGASGPGRSYLILGSTITAGLEAGKRVWNLEESDAIFEGETDGDESGLALAGAGDVNGDGFDDILIGSWNRSEDNEVSRGKAYLILGSAKVSSSAVQNLASADAHFLGWGAGDNFGHSLAAVGDVDADGLSDLVFGASGNDLGGNQAGKTYLLLGGSITGRIEEANSVSQAALWNFQTDTPDVSFVGEQAGSQSGRAVSSVGDVDGDGQSDLLIGAPDFGNFGINRGKTYLVLGSSVTALL
ncbi:MAG: MopE-related protein, partial [Myxococcota bacterium]|nr:MopE-related protein [Myxococcota bacterium]